MSTPKPTGNGPVSAASSYSGKSHSGNGREGNGHAVDLGWLAPWMPDEATLTRLAGDVLANMAADSLPGLDTGGPAPHPSAGPSSPPAPPAPAPPAPAPRPPTTRAPPHPPAR